MEEIIVPLGKFVASRYQFPEHIDLLEIKDTGSHSLSIDTYEIVCGGTLLTLLIILTNAHCPLPSRYYIARAGALSSNENPFTCPVVQDREIIRWGFFATFAKTDKGLDLAVCKVKNKFTMTPSVKPATIPDNWTIFDNAEFFMPGRGCQYNHAQSLHKFTNALLYAKIHFFENPDWSYLLEDEHHKFGQTDVYTSLASGESGEGVVSFINNEIYLNSVIDRSVECNYENCPGIFLELRNLREGIKIMMTELENINENELCI